MPVGLDAILSRIAQISQPPAAVAQLESRFASMMGQQAAASATDVADAPASTVATSPTTSSGFSTATASSRVTTSGETAAGMAPATITRGTSTVMPAGTVMPTGTWVDRIPSAKGKALAPEIAAAAAKYNLDPAFLSAVFWTESSYTPDAVSRTGAIGLGQLMPETAQWLGVNPWDATQNIDGSAKFYRYLLDRNNGDLTLAIASYAAGPGAVKKAGGVPDQFTRDYITKLVARRDYIAGTRSTAP